MKEMNTENISLLSMNILLLTTRILDDKSEKCASVTVTRLVFHKPISAPQITQTQTLTN